MAANSELVYGSLEEFIKKHTPNAELGGIDEIVMAYVVGVVEDAVVGESIDAEGVKELVAAYVPSFSDVSIEDITQWIEDTVQTIKKLTEKGKDSPSVTLDSIVSSFPCETKRVHSSDSASLNQDDSPKSRKASNSSSIDSTSALETLIELFPNACKVDLERYLHTAGGDVDHAIGIMLDAPQPIRMPAIDSAMGKPATPKVDDDTIKASIINKYSFIDKDEDRREHRPIMPKWEGKKMVRYRDNKVVSLKGERYTEVKKEDPEFVKKTSVHLKPGKQYRFH